MKSHDSGNPPYEDRVVREFREAVAWCFGMDEKGFVAANDPIFMKHYSKQDREHDLLHDWS